MDLLVIPNIQNTYSRDHAKDELPSWVDVLPMDHQIKKSICEITIDDLFYKILGENTGFEIKGKETHMSLMTKLSQVKREYDKIEGAIREVREVSYGIVAPSIDELSLEEPEIVRQGSRYGVRLKASATSIHSTDVDIKTEVLTEVIIFNEYKRYRK